MPELARPDWHHIPDPTELRKKLRFASARFSKHDKDHALRQYFVLGALLVAHSQLSTDIGPVRWS